MSAIGTVLGVLVAAAGVLVAAVGVWITYVALSRSADMASTAPRDNFGHLQVTQSGNNYQIERPTITINAGGGRVETPVPASVAPSVAPAVSAPAVSPRDPAPAAIPHHEAANPAVSRGHHRRGSAVLGNPAGDPSAVARGDQSEGSVSHSSVTPLPRGDEPPI